MAWVPENAVCLHCGYALRGLPGTVCPECGRAFDPADSSTWRDTEWPRHVWLLRRWAGPLPLWHKVLTLGCTIVAVDALSFLPYRRMDEIDQLWLIGFAAMLMGLFLSFLLRRRAGQLCFIHGLFSGRSVSELVCESRIVRACGWVLCFSILLGPLGLLSSPRVLLSMPFMEYKARQVNRVGRSDNRPQFVGLFRVRRVGLLGDGGIKLQFTSFPGGTPGSEALVYYSWFVPTPPDKATGLLRWYWMTW